MLGTSIGYLTGNMSSTLPSSNAHQAISEGLSMSVVYDGSRCCSSIKLAGLSMAQLCCYTKDAAIPRGCRLFVVLVGCKKHSFVAGNLAHQIDVLPSSKVQQDL